MGRKKLPEDERKRPVMAHVSPDLLEQLQARADEERVSVSRVVEWAVAAYFEKPKRKR